MGEFGRQQTTIDQMFAQTEKRPFSGFNPSAVVEEQESIPYLQGTIAQDLNFTPMIQSILDRGVPNGLWVEGPPEDNVVLDDTYNKLPGWTFVAEQGTSVEITRQADSSSRAGYSIVFEATDPATGDGAYIEAIVPVKTLDKFMFPAGKFNRNATNMGNANFILNSQFLKADLTTTGSSFGALITASGESTKYSWRVIPSDALYLRIRIRMVVTTGFSGTHHSRCREVWALPPDVSWVTLPGIYTGTFTQGDTIEMPIYDEGNFLQTFHRYVATSYGLLYSLSGRLVAARTAGNCQVWLENVTTATEWGDQITFDDDPTNNAYVLNDLDGLSEPMFSPGDNLRLVLKPSGAWTPTANDIIATAQLMCYNV